MKSGTPRDLHRKESVNFTVVKSFECLYSIYLLSETKRKQHKSLQKLILKSY